MDADSHSETANQDRQPPARDVSWVARDEPPSDTEDAAPAASYPSAPRRNRPSAPAAAGAEPTANLGRRGTMGGYSTMSRALDSLHP
ncbi:hypothetical protein FRB90_012779, partial [Tulasnella sp. 427]